MNIIICIDDENGMMFNNRRQSRDRAVIKDIMETINSNRLFINKYSEPLFKNYDANIAVSDDFLEQADENDYCFVENMPLLPFENRINSITVYKWNRLYPSDTKLDINPDKFGHIVSSCDFEGYSHEKITKEIYVK